MPIERHSSQKDISSFLTHAEESFLSSVCNGPDALAKFDDDWSSMEYDLRTQDVIYPELGSLAQNLSERVAALASSFLDLHVSEESLGQSLMSEVGDILDGAVPEPVVLGGTYSSSNVAKRHHTSPPAHSIHINGESSRTSVSKDFLHVRHWFTNNICSPYPSASTKRDLVKRSNATNKSIDDWLTSARRKTGWTAFMKRHFKGDRSLAQDCAHRVLITGTGCDSYCKEVVEEMKGIKAAAERFFGDKRDGAEPSSFAKELEELDASLLAVPKSRRRGMSTASTNSNRSSTSFSSSSTSNSRKRSREASEESDATAYSEDADVRELRPLKRGRSAESFISSSSSSAPSLATCASDSGGSSSPELITPAPSPVQTKLSLDLFDDWIEGLSAEAAFLPHDLSDNLQSVLSVKRASSDSAPDVPSKRARIEKRQASQTSQPRTIETVEEPRPVSAQQSPAQLSTALTIAGETITNQTGAELNETIVSQFLSQLDFAIPQAPVPSFDTCSAALEADPFDFSSIGYQADSSSDLPTDLNALLASFPNSEGVVSTPDEELAALIASQNAHGDGNSNNASLSSNPIVPIDKLAEDLNAIAQGNALFPISFSSLDIAFLAGLHDEVPYPPKPDSLNAPIVPPCDVNSANSLIDVPPSSEPDCANLNDLERVQKLERISALYAEAHRLQQEVFG